MMFKTKQNNKNIINPRQQIREHRLIAKQHTMGGKRCLPEGSLNLRLEKTGFANNLSKPLVFRSHSTTASRPRFLPQPHLKLRMKDNLTHGHWNMREVLKHHPEET